MLLCLKDRFHHHPFMQNHAFLRTLLFALCLQPHAVSAGPKLLPVLKVCENDAVSRNVRPPEGLRGL